jgi:hypothetical protein
VRSIALHSILNSCCGHHSLLPPSLQISHQQCYHSCQAQASWLLQGSGWIGFRWTVRGPGQSLAPDGCSVCSLEGAWARRSPWGSGFRPGFTVRDGAVLAVPRLSWLLTIWSQASHLTSLSLLRCLSSGDIYNL